MAWFDELNNMPDTGTIRQYQAPKKPDKKKKSFLLDQLSTAGGIIGGIGGSFIAPIAGTAGGATVGSGLGEALENIISGESAGKNVLKEAALGGVFAAPPIRLGKAVLSAGRAGKTAAGVTEQAATAATREPLKTSFRGKLTDLGNKALESQYGTIRSPIARATNPTETLGTLADYGLTKKTDVERIADQFTGSNGIVSKAVLKAVGKSGRVNVDGMQQVFDDALQLNGVVESGSKSANAVFRAQMNKLMGGPAGSLKPDANPNDVLDVMKAFEKRIADLSGKGSNYRLTDPARIDQAKTLQAVHDELEDRLFQTAAKNKSLSSVLTPEFRSELISLKPGDAKWEQFVDKSVMGSKDIGELRSTMAPFVKARKIVEDGEQNSMTFGGRTGNSVTSGLAGIFDPITGAAANLVQGAAREPIARATGQTLRAAGATETPQVGSKLGRAVGTAGIAARVGGAGLVGGAYNQMSQPGNLEDSLLQQSNIPPSFSSMQPSDFGATPQNDNNPLSPTNLQNSVQKIISSGGTLEDASKFVSLVEALQKVQSAGQPKQDKLSSTQQETASRAQNALNDIEILGAAIQNGALQKTAVPGSGTAFGGRLLGTTDIEAALFNIGDVILRSRTGAQAPESEIKKFVSGFLPRAGESVESQNSKLQRAYRELSGMVNPSAQLNTI